MAYCTEYGVQDWITAPLSTGTSIMAAEYKGGVIIGSDSRTTTGAYIANRVTDKLTKITDNIYCCRSGSAADTQAISDIVAYQLNVHSLELGHAPLVAMGASVFRELCYQYRDKLMVGIIVAGWDNKLGGQVYNIPVGGMCVRQPVALGGSGSSYVYGYVDASFKRDMTKKECATFVTNITTVMCYCLGVYAFSLAMDRDGSSGGVVRLGIINKDGVERIIIDGDKLPKFFDDYE